MSVYLDTTLSSSSWAVIALANTDSSVSKLARSFMENLNAKHCCARSYTCSCVTLAGSFSWISLRRSSRKDAVFLASWTS